MKNIRVYGRIHSETGEFENFSEHRSPIFDTHTAILTNIEKIKVVQDEDPFDLLTDIYDLGNKLPANIRKRLSKLINSNDEWD